MGVYKIDL
jgi:hypothetical protein